MATTLAISVAPRWREGFLISPLHDFFFFILSPLWALAVALAVSHWSFAGERVWLLGAEQPRKTFILGALISAHLVVSFARSHGNPSVFSQHRLRFTVVPVLLLIALVGSDWLRAAALALAVLWDVHHSGMQTFGLARMYDRLAGNDPRVGRTGDLLLNHLLYAGPILAGAGFLYHVNALHGFESVDGVGAAFFSALPAHSRNARPAIALAVIAIGVPFLAYYIVSQVRLARAAHRISWQKVTLLAATGVCSVVSWGFNSFGEALLTMKLFHVVQYFALISWMERKNVAERLSPRRDRVPFLWLMGGLLALAGVYGLWAEVQSALPVRSEIGLSLIVTVTLMHFWYDGFMWSVRKRQL